MTTRSPIFPRPRLASAAGCLALGLSALGLLAVAGPAGFGQQPPRRVKVTIQDATPVVQEIALPIEPQIRAQPSFPGAMSYGLNVDGKRLTFSSGSARTMVRVDGNIFFPNAQQRPLGPGPRGKPRHGVTSTYVQNNVHITQVLEIVPGKPSVKPKPGQKRQMDTLLIRYLIENKDTRSHDVGVRVRIDTYCWTNDGCLFASPEKHPGKILNGVTLKGKDLPDYLQILQNNNLQNPGWVAHFTCKVGRYDPPSRVVCTSHGAGENGWEVQVIPAQGDSDAAFYWDPVKIPAGGKRELAFAHGQGIATSPENEGRVNLDLGGSFEPGKAFTATAYVHDPVEGQSLALEVPPGMELVRGKEIQPVPAPNESNSSIVQWRARVLRPGTFALRLRSSNGVTYTKNITVALAGAP
jgi:hypothetical protein